MALDNLTPDKFQQVIINLRAERTAVVKGVAGTGKSFILLKKAKQVSTITNSYAIIVYTKTLKQFFVDELAEIGSSEGHVFYFDEWKKSTKSYFEYMFVDECQDFNTNEINDFRSHAKYLWCFGDSSQSIMKFNNHDVQSVEDTARQLEVHTLDFGLNHRLTKENAKIGEYICPETHLTLSCYKHGPKPSLLCSNSQLDTIIEIIKNNTLISPGILVYYNTEVIYIRDYFAQHGIPVQWKTKDTMEMDFHSNSPKIVTFHCAKGLQFNDVFIPFCGIGEYHNYYPNPYAYDPVITGKCKSAFFVANTRVLEKLYLLYSSSLTNWLPKYDSLIYFENDINDDDYLPF